MYLRRVVVIDGCQTRITVVMSRSTRGKREGRLIIPDVLDVHLTKRYLSNNTGVLICTN